MSVPSIQISPESGRSKRVMHRARVDFPDPEAPTNASVCPSWISKSTSFTACTDTRLRHRPPRTYCFDTAHTRSNGSAARLDRLIDILKTAHRPRWFEHDLLRVMLGTY